MPQSDPSPILFKDQPEQWDGIAQAADTVASGNAKRIDGNGWKVYATPGVIRVDIENKENH